MPSLHITSLNRLLITWEILLLTTWGILLPTLGIIPTLGTIIMVTLPDILEDHGIVVIAKNHASLKMMITGNPFKEMLASGKITLRNG